MIVSTMPGRNGGVGRGEWSSFARQVLVGRWFCLFASFLLMTSAGGFYLFAYYSNNIKETLKCDQTTLNKISFYKALGSNIGIVGGLLADVAPSWCLLVLCAVVNFIGYFKVWQGVTGQIVHPTIGFFGFYITIGGNSQNLVNTVVLLTGLKNFPERRGIMLGLLKGFLGLGGAVMAQMYLSIYGGDTKSLIFLLAWFPSLIALMFAGTIREVKVVKNPNEFRVFIQYLWITIILALLLTVLIIVQKRVQLDRAANIFTLLAITCLLLLPFFIAIREELAQWNLTKMSKFGKPQSSPQSPLTLTPSSSTSQQSHQSNSYFEKLFHRPERGEDYTILEAIFSIDMLVLYPTMIIGIGSSFTAMDNLTQIGESQGYSTATINSLISLVNIFNFAGRIFSGFVSEIMLEKFKVPRPLMLTFTLLISCIGHLLVAFPFESSLYWASIIIGFALGSQIPLYFSMISEIFGLKHYSMLYNFGQLSCPIGTYILNVLVTGELYDEVAKTGADASEFKCNGNRCYRDSFMIMTWLTLLGAGMALILVRRTREFYRGDIYKKFREDLDSLKTDVELYPIHEKKTEMNVDVNKQR